MTKVFAQASSVNCRLRVRCLFSGMLNFAKISLAPSCLLSRENRVLLVLWHFSRSVNSLGQRYFLLLSFFFSVTYQNSPGCTCYTSGRKFSPSLHPPPFAFSLEEVNTRSMRCTTELSIWFLSGRFFPLFWPRIIQCFCICYSNCGRVFRASHAACRLWISNPTNHTIDRLLEVRATGFSFRYSYLWLCVPRWHFVQVSTFPSTLFYFKWNVLIDRILNRNKVRLYKEIKSNWFTLISFQKCLRKKLQEL